MLYVGALCFSKISSLAYILQVTPDSGHRMWGRVILLAVLVWTVFALFGIAFECRLPNPWAIVTEKCIKIVSPSLINHFPATVLIPKTECPVGCHRRLRHRDRHCVDLLTYLYCMESSDDPKSQSLDICSFCVQNHVLCHPCNS